MTAHTPSPATDRDLAISRLRRLTTGVAVAGVAAVGGLGYLAALHYSGQASTAGAVAAANTATTTTTTSTDDSTTALDDDSVSGSTLQGSTGQVSSSSGSAQVTTGGS